MDNKLLLKVLTIVFLTAMPVQTGFAANLSVPSWAYDSVQTLADDSIINLPSGVTDVKQAHLNRKDMALLVIGAIDNLKDKGVYASSGQKNIDISNVSKKAQIFSDAVYELGRVSGRYDALVAEYTANENKYSQYLKQMERKSQALGNISSVKQDKLEESYKITADEFQRVVMRMGEINALKQSYQDRLIQLKAKKEAAEKDLQNAIKAPQPTVLTLEENQKNNIYNSEIVKVDALKVEFDKELRDLGMAASYVAGSVAISPEADADTVAEGEKYSYTGEARFSYANNSGAAIDEYRQSRLRVRLYGEAKLNKDWAARGMLESNKYFLDNNHGETDWVNFDRYYLHGLTGATTIDIGRFGYNIADGNVYDTSFNGIKASVGKAIEYGFIAGQTSDKAETYGITAKYKSYDYDVEVGAHSFGADKWDSAERLIAHGGINYYFNNFKLGAIYLHSDLKDSTGNKDGYVGTFSYGKLKTWEKGTYEFQAKYYRQPFGTYVTHTMSGLAGKVEGFKGLGLFFYYTIDPNVVAGIEYYRLRTLLDEKQADTLWGQISYYF